MSRIFDVIGQTLNKQRQVKTEFERQWDLPFQISKAVWIGTLGVVYSDRRYNLRLEHVGFDFFEGYYSNVIIY